MGLFDFFRKKPAAIKQTITTAPVDNNTYLLQVLSQRLSELGYQVEKHQQHLALIINGDIEIATMIIDHPGSHPSILHLMILTMHPTYFVGGIEENLAGIGSTLDDKVDSAVDNYIRTTFTPIIESLSDRHDPELDFFTVTGGRKVLWHPHLGNLSFQGQWGEQPQNEPFFEIIKDRLEEKLTSSKFNWLKLYISKQANGNIIGECIFNNEPWEEGLADITSYAQSWKLPGDFQGLKQFMVFRRCDSYDE